MGQVVLGALALLLALLVASAAGLIISIPLYFAWNYVAPALGLATITYWQAFALFIVGRCLVQSGG